MGFSPPHFQRSVLHHLGRKSWTERAFIFIKNKNKKQKSTIRFLMMLHMWRLPNVKIVFITVQVRKWTEHVVEPLRCNTQQPRRVQLTCFKSVKKTTLGPCYDQYGHGDPKRSWQRSLLAVVSAAVFRLPSALLCMSPPDTLSEGFRGNATERRASGDPPPSHLPGFTLVLLSDGRRFHRFPRNYGES